MNNRKSINERLLKIFIQLNIETTTSDQFFKQIDSIQLYMLVAEIEAEFNIQISPIDVNEITFSTFKSILTYLNSVDLC